MVTNIMLVKMNILKYKFGNSLLKFFTYYPTIIYYPETNKLRNIYTRLSIDT